VEKYKALLKVLIKQGMIKLLEEQIEIRCLRNEERIVAEVINECQQEFNSICEISTKL
jgi:V-type H+-transporting ATPase subunit E